jgi:hypothetical protein
VITSDDVNFHTPDDVDYVWAETNYFAFHIPEQNLVCMVYVVARAGTGACVGEVIVFNTLTLDRRKVVYFDSDHHMPVPKDLSNYTLPNGISIQSVNPPRDYRIDYLGIDGTEFHLDVRGLMEPYDIHDPDMCPTVPPQRADQVTGSGFGAGYSGHFDMTVKVTGTFTLFGRTFDVDCVDTMDHSWGPRAFRGMTAIGWQHAHFGEDYAVHAIWRFDPEAAPDRQFTVAHGYALVDGEVRGLVEGAMGVARQDGDGLPVCLRIDVLDRTGERHKITGAALASNNWVCYTSLQISHVYCEYRAGARVGYGVHQEAFPLDMLARNNSREVVELMDSRAAP